MSSLFLLSAKTKNILTIIFSDPYLNPATRTAVWPALIIFFQIWICLFSFCLKFQVWKETLLQPVFQRGWELKKQNDVVCEEANDIFLTFNQYCKRKSHHFICWSPVAESSTFVTISNFVVHYSDFLNLSAFLYYAFAMFICELQEMWKRY